MMLEVLVLWRAFMKKVFDSSSWGVNFDILAIAMTTIEPLEFRVTNSTFTKIGTSSRNLETTSRYLPEAPL
jgi:hypothetical protein